MLDRFYIFNLLSLLILNYVLVFGENVDYCNKDLCKRRLPHIACENDGKINSTCANYSEIIDLPPEVKANIVKKHNEYRNKLAMGEVPNYKPATCMGTMQWHDELARMADLNVKSCSTTHDRCRNTYNFLHSGQNIARRTTPLDSFTMEQAEYNINRGIDRWFKEHKICPKDGTTVYRSNKKVCGHFTVMIAERNIYVGCAMLLMKKKRTVFTCNYAWTNMKNEELYKPGTTASECKTGLNEEYSGLCSTMETYALTHNGIQ